MPPPDSWFVERSAAPTLVNEEPLDAARWVRMLEARRLLINSYLKSMSLKTLADITYWGRTMRLTAGLRSGWLDWSYPGIFGDPDWQEVDEFTLRIWGLSRKGEFIWVVIYFDPSQRWMKRSERTVIGIDVVPATATDFAKAGLRLARIWRSLGSQIRQWRDHRRVLYEAAEAGAAQVDFDERLLLAWQRTQDSADRA